MAEWCMEHPWMTFFIVITFFSSLSPTINVITSDRRRDK